MDKDKKKIIVGAGILAGAGLAAYFATRKKAQKPPVLEITLSNLNITPTTVFPGQTVTISVLATNHSDSALAATIDLKGDFTDSQTVSLNTGTSQTVNFTITPTADGTYHVSVDGLSGSFICTSAPHGDIVLSDLMISPTTCNEGDTVTISVTATNNGNANEVMAVTLNLTGNKYADTWQEVHQIILESGASQVVTFTYQPTVAETYAVTVDSLSGSFVVNPATTWPGWTAGTVVYGLTATPTILYLGQTVTIIVDIEGPWPATYPMNIEATINVDGTTLSNIFSIDFRNPGLLFTYTPTKVGEYIVTAQDKTAPFTVLANPTGTYYSPFGGKRMPLCTDIVIPNVPPFILRHGTIGRIVFNWPGGDLKYSELYGHTSTSLFFLLGIEGLLPQEVLSLISSAEPCAWRPDSASITSWVKALNTVLGTNIQDILVMATEYTCQEYWDSKNDLANMIAQFVDVSWQLYPSDWRRQYGVICPKCGGTGRTSSGHICLNCDGAGYIWGEIDLSCGIRDWTVSKRNLYIVSYYSYTYTCKIKCPYCNQYLETGAYSDSPGHNGRLDAARGLLEHIESVHPNHPLTEPAWF